MDILGLIIGAALGDALGGPHEFRHCKVQYTGKLEYPIHVFRRFIKPYHFFTPVGQVTDDTEMLLILARSIAKYGKYDVNKIIPDYLEWANSKTTWAMGRNTRQLFKGVKTVRGYKARYTKSQEARKNNQSNGALMRCAILAILLDKQDMDELLEDCKLTNENEICVDTNRVYLQIVYQALTIRQDLTKDKTALLQYIKDIAITEPVRDVINSALDNKSNRNVTVSKGWCLHALYCTIYAISHFDNYKSGIDWVINQGGDTDTNACIAGALMGSYYGYEHIVEHEENNVNILLSCDTNTGDFPRDEKYTLHDIFELIKLL